MLSIEAATVPLLASKHAATANASGNRRPAEGPPAGCLGIIMTLADLITLMATKRIVNCYRMLLLRSRFRVYSMAVGCSGRKVAATVIVLCEVLCRPLLLNAYDVYAGIRQDAR